MHTVSQVLWSLIEMADWSWHYPATNDEKQNDSLTTQQGSDHHAPVHSHSLEFVRDSPRPFIEDFGTDRVAFEPWEPLDHRQTIENSLYILCSLLFLIYLTGKGQREIQLDSIYRTVYYGLDIVKVLQPMSKPWCWGFDVRVGYKWSTSETSPARMCTC